MFSKVLLIKLGINIFNEEQITLAFDYFLNTLEATENQFFYRDFVSHFYDINLQSQNFNEGKSQTTSVFQET